MWRVDWDGSGNTSILALSRSASWVLESLATAVKRRDDDETLHPTCWNLVLDVFAPFFNLLDAFIFFGKVGQCNRNAATAKTQAVYTCPSSFWNHLWDAQARCTMDTAISMSFPVAFRSYQAKTTLTVRPGRPRRRMQTTQAYTVCCTDVFPVKIDELCNVNFLSNVEVTSLKPKIVNYVPWTYFQHIFVRSLHFCLGFEGHIMIVPGRSQY